MTDRPAFVLDSAKLNPESPPMRMLDRSAATVALFVVISVGTAARGDSLLVGNLAKAPGGSDPVAELAQLFVVGPQDWKTTSIDAVLGGLGVGTFAASATLVGSSTNASGDHVPNPADILATFAFPPVGAGFSTLSFAPAANLVLHANTEYWFLLRLTTANAATFEWQSTNDTSVDPGSIGSLGSSASFSTLTNAWTLQADARYLIQVNGDPVATLVPEPSSWLLGGFAASGVFALLHRRRRAAA